VKQVSV